MARGRRVNSNGERSKKLLLEKAIELFSIHGYHQTKISDIVKAANLTQPTFYLYFQSKESLFKDLNTNFKNQLYEIFNSGLTQTVHDVKCIRTKLAENLKQIFRYFAENPNLTRIGFYESEEATQVKAELVKRLVATIENERGQFAALNNVDIQILAESFVGSVERLTLTNLLTNESEPEKLAEDIVDIYFAHKLELANK